jgi:hypothetical protein
LLPSATAPRPPPHHLGCASKAIGVIACEVGTGKTAAMRAT